MKRYIWVLVLILICSGCSSKSHEEMLPETIPEEKFIAVEITDDKPQPDIDPQQEPLLEVPPEAYNTLYGFCREGQWGIINGGGEIVVEPAYAFSAVLKNGMYLLSTDPEHPNSGKLYSADGEAFFTEYGDITVFGGGPDGNTAYIELRVFLYEENGLKGMVLADGTRLTEAKYDDVKGDYTKSYYRTLKDGKLGIATLEGELTPPVYDYIEDYYGHVRALGVGDNVTSFLFSAGKINGEWQVYKGNSLFMAIDNGYDFEHLRSCLYYYNGDYLQVMDMDGNVLHAFDNGIYYNYDGPIGASSINGLLYLSKREDEKYEYAVADCFGNFIIPFGANSIHWREDLGLIYIFHEEWPVAHFYNIDGIYLYTGDVRDLPEYQYDYEYLFDLNYYDDPESVFSLGLSPYSMEQAYFRWVTDGSHSENLHSTLYRLMSSDI